MADKIEIEIELEPSLGPQAQKKIVKQAGKAGDKSGKKFSKEFGGEVKKNTKALFGPLVGAATAAATAVAAVFAGRAVVAAAARQEEAVNALNAALRNSGNFSKVASAGIQAFASSLQSVTRFGDEAILEQVAFAQAMGATVGQSQSVVAAATDMAEALNIDLNSAVRLIAKTLGGYVGELGESIPAIKKFTKAQLQSGDAIGFLADRFKGFAQEATTTFQGALDQTSNSFGDLREEIGFLITKNETVIKSVKKLNVIFVNSARLISENKDKITSFIGDGIKRLKEAYDKIITSLKRFKKELIQIATLSALIVVFTQMTAALLSLKTIMSAMSLTALPAMLKGLVKLGPKGWLVAGAVTAATGAVALFNKVVKESAAPRDLGEKLAFTNSKIIETTNVIGDLRRKFDELKALGPVDRGIQGIFKIKLDQAESDLESYNKVFRETMKAMSGEGQPDPKAEPNSILSIIDRIRNALLKPLPELKLNIQEESKQSLSEILGELRLFSSEVSGLAELDLKLVPELTGEEQAILDTLTVFGQKLDHVRLKAKQLAIDWAKVSKSIKNAAVEGIGRGIASGFNAVGVALVNGENALKAFGKAFAAAIGQAAVQLGTRFILEGVAISFHPFLGPAIGGPLIAAGAALATFGGALGAIVGGGGAAGGGGGGGAAGGGEVSGGISGDIEEDEAVAEVPETTAVNIVIQGDVLDSEESGLRIANILNDAFDKQGVVIKGAAA